MAYNSSLLQMRNASDLHAVALKSILANRKLSSNHRKGVNSGLDSPKVT